MNRPYIPCNKYESEKELLSGKKPVYWNYITKEDDLFDLEQGVVTDDRYYKTYNTKASSKSYFVVPGRWVKIQTGYWDHAVRFATLVDPVQLQLIVISIWYAIKKSNRHQMKRSSSLRLGIQV
ncbi:MAG: hypothetical protein KA436_06120 [Oligoflexales bacterium]|nr:hypothetical protein [Oligoflexales bacterium]